MRVWKDSDGREWILDMTVGAMLRVRGLAGVDIPDQLRADLMLRLPLDPVLVGEIAWAMIQPQAATKNIAKEAFLDGLKTEAVQTCVSALTEELADFFPSIGGPIRKLADWAARQSAADVEANVAKALGLAGGSGGRSGGLPESPE